LTPYIGGSRDGKERGRTKSKDWKEKRKRRERTRKGKDNVQVLDKTA